MSQELSERPIDMVLLFDSCMPRMADCGQDCSSNETILCPHRFKFEARIKYGNGYIKFLRFYDFQIILHFLYLLINDKIKGDFSSKCHFVIVTKDRKFLHSAEKEWSARSKKEVPDLQFDSDENNKRFVRANINIGRGKRRLIKEITIWIEDIDANGRNKIRAAIIERLNNLFSAE